MEMTPSTGFSEFAATEFAGIPTALCCDTLGPHLLRPGLSCRVHVSLPSVADALVIPVASVADHSGTSVVTVIRDGKTYETTVTLGAETDQQVQVLEGLVSGDTVAIAGGYGLPDGCQVEIVDRLKSSPAAVSPSQLKAEFVKTA